MAPETSEKSCSCSWDASGPEHAATTKAAASVVRRQLLIVGIGLPVWVLLYWQLHNLANLLTFRVFGLTAGTHLGEAVAFFLFEVPRSCCC